MHEVHYIPPLKFIFKIIAIIIYLDGTLNDKKNLITTGLIILSVCLLAEIILLILNVIVKGLKKGIVSYVSDTYEYMQIYNNIYILGYVCMLIWSGVFYYLAKQPVIVFYGCVGETIYPKVPLIIYFIAVFALVMTVLHLIIPLISGMRLNKKIKNLTFL